MGATYDIPIKEIKPASETQMQYISFIYGSEIYIDLI